MSGDSDLAATVIRHSKSEILPFACAAAISYCRPAKREMADIGLLVNGLD